MGKVSIAASLADIWVNCTGSATLRAKYKLPDENKQSRKEGLTFHDLAKQVIEMITHPRIDAPIPGDFINTISVHDVLITQEMYEASVEYANDIFRCCNQKRILGEVQIEKETMLPVFGEGERCHPDVFVIDKDHKEIFIWDAKFGHSIVEVYENYQLLIYLMGITQNGDWSGWKVNLTIYQPRARHPLGISRTWSDSYENMATYFDKIIFAAYETKSGEGKLTPGRHCKQCVGKRACVANERAVFDIIDLVKYSDDTSELKGNELSLELSLLRDAKLLVESRYDALNAQAKYEMLNGAPLPGQKLETIYGNTVFDKLKITELLTIGDLMKIDLRKPEDVITPKQAIAVGLDENIVSQYSKTNKNGVKVVADDGTLAKLIFGGS